jgi:putative peptide zinc metalloprotease protein
LNPEQPTYLRFSARHAEHRGDGHNEHVLVTAQSGQRYRLTPAEYALAQLHNGERDAQARLNAATGELGRKLDADTLERFTHDLVEADLLEPGRREALPPPRQLTEHITDRDRRIPGDSFPPSSLPGSMANPGKQGPVGGAGAGVRGGDTRPRIPLPVTPLLGLGHALNIGLYFRPIRWLLWLLVLVALYGLWINRGDAARDAMLLLAPYRLIFVSLLSAFLVNLLSQAARAAAVVHYSGERPDFGLNLGFGFIPRLHTDTEGAAERADVSGRMHIIGSVLNATLGLFVLAVLGWFLSRNSGTFLPTLMLGLAVLSMVGFLLRINPLSRRDGYFLLAHSLNVPDLRDQSWISIFGFERPWHQGKPPPVSAMRIYALAGFAYMVTVVTLLVLYPGRWLGNYFGGTGVAIFVALMALAIWEQSRRARSDRGRIEPMKLSMQRPTRTQWLVYGLLALLALFPYTYAPSGRVVVLPADRADVRALVPGDVREVFVAEGEDVEAGQEIVRLGDEQQIAQVAASEARLRRMEAELALLDAGAANEEIELAKQRVATARRRADVSSAEARRQETANRRGAVSSQEYDRVRGIADVHKEELAEAERQLEVVQRQARDEQRTALEAEADAERAQLAFFRTQLENTRVRPPIAGRIVSGSLMFMRGSYLDAGDLLATVEDHSRLLAEVQMPESTISEVRVGAEATVRSWTAPGTGVRGVVRHIAPNAEQGDYGKVVRVIIELENNGGHLKPEMTGRAKIEGGTYPAIVVFTRALVRFFMVEVWSWLP